MPLTTQKVPIDAMGDFDDEIKKKIQSITILVYKV